MIARYFAFLLALLGPMPDQPPAGYRLVAFDGVVGQSRQVAFQNLCHAREKLLLRIVHFPSRKMIGNQPLRCSAWKDLQGSDWWGLENESDQCPDRSNQLVVVNLSGDTVFNVHVWCRRHAQASP